jgi:hypothetical protein
VHLELVRERLELEELWRLGALVQEADGAPQHVEVERDLFSHLGA